MDLRYIGDGRLEAMARVVGTYLFVGDSSFSRWYIPRMLQQRMVAKGEHVCIIRDAENAWIDGLVPANRPSSVMPAFDPILYSGYGPGPVLTICARNTHIPVLKLFAGPVFMFHHVPYERHSWELNAYDMNLVDHACRVREVDCGHEYVINIIKSLLGIPTGSSRVRAPRASDIGKPEPDDIMERLYDLRGPAANKDEVSLLLAKYKALTGRERPAFMS
jgi:hypothetical protein